MSRSRALSTPNEDLEGGSDAARAHSSAISLPARSFVAFAPFSLKDGSMQQGWTQDSFDIREGSVRLGSLAFATPSSNLPQPPRTTSISKRRSSLSTYTEEDTPPSSFRPSQGAQPSALSKSPLAKHTPGTTPTPSGLSQIFKSATQPDLSGKLSGSNSEDSTGSSDTVVGDWKKSEQKAQAPEILIESAQKNHMPSLEESSELGEARFSAARTATETSPLLGKLDKQLAEQPTSLWQDLAHNLSKSSSRFVPHIDKKRAKAALTPRNVGKALLEPVQYIPAVILGILLNLLDGVSYGLITFPTTPIFASFGGIGVSMFFVSCIVSQLVTSSRSVFKGGNGSMMIEVVPFFHSLVFSISADIGEDQPHSVIATVMVAFAISSILTGLVFLLLGQLRMGILLEFFPRHILVGCIGGIGAFLIITGLQVTARLDEEHLPDFSWKLIEMYMSDAILPLWSIPLGLCIVLRVITEYFAHPLIIPGFFCIVAACFYIITMPILHISLADLRSTGWVFDLGEVQTPWYEFWSLYDLKAVNMRALVNTIPTQLALVFFAMLHVPLNVPALALSTSEENLKTDEELVNHGISNLLSGFVGTVPNYLVYTNSVLFYRVGGTARLAGYMLAVATAGVMMIGPQVIGLLPVMVVGALIYLLGLDLLKEAVWDTWSRVSPFEYFTIWVIIVVMTCVDFIAGIGCGIVVACISFVVTSSQRAAVRQILTGSSARSTVRRHPMQSSFLREVGSQIRVIKLQGQVFFGTASRCETTIKGLLEAAEWSEKPIRYLVLDFSMVNGVDFSAAEAFLRIERLCNSKDVVLVLCGCTPDSVVGRALRAVNLWANAKETSKVEVFENLNDSLEHCENSQLRSLYSKNLFPPAKPEQVNNSLLGNWSENNNITVSPSLEAASPSMFENSPRRKHLYTAAKETIGLGKSTQPKRLQLVQPLPLLIQTFSSYTSEVSEPEQFFHQLVPYFTKMQVERGTVLWKDGDQASNFYLIEMGALKLVKDMEDLGHCLVETMLPASVCGELSFLSDVERASTLTVERDAVIWKCTREAFERLETELNSTTVRQFRKTLLRVATENQEVVMGHLLTAL